MKQLKRYAGILWMLIGPAVFILLIISAIRNISANAEGDISNPIPWLIIIIIFLPVAIGLTIFGWYCWNGEYDRD